MQSNSGTRSKIVRKCQNHISKRKILEFRRANFKVVLRFQPSSPWKTLTWIKHNRIYQVRYLRNVCTQPTRESGLNGPLPYLYIDWKKLSAFTFIQLKWVLKETGYDIFWWFSNTVLYKHQCIFLKTFLSPLFRSSGQINSLHYHDDTSEKEFICSAEDSSGMHKCSKLPPFDDQNGMACHAR